MNAIKARLGEREVRERGCEDFLRLCIDFGWKRGLEARVDFRRKE